MMIAPAAITKARDILDDGDFYRDSHSRIFRAILKLDALGEPVDPLTVTAELESSGDLKDVGGKVRVYEIARLVPASANVGHYAGLVRDAATRRGLIRASSEIAELAWAWDSGEPVELIGRAEQLVEELREREAETDSIVNLHESALYLDEKFRNPPDHSSWIRGPWRWVSPMGPGRLYVLSGYAKDGKTSAGCQFFEAAAKDAVSTTYLTLEMSKEDLAERLAATMGIPARAVQTGRLEQYGDVARNVIERMTQLAPHARIWDAPAVDIATIRAHVKAVRPRLLIVDHLHQFHLRSEYERQDLEGIVRGLWRIAREFQMTILLLAQLSRARGQKTSYPAPTMSALKGSGAIEQLAWAVWFVYRLRDSDDLPGEESSFICAANRSGPTGTKRLSFDPRRVRFTEVTTTE